MINKKEKYLIAIDLDGTLLNDDKTISPFTIKVLNSLEKEGNFIVLCSGRASRSVQYYHNEILKLESSPIICYNGHLATNPHDASFNKVNHILNKDTVSAIYKELSGKKLIESAMSESTTKIFIDLNDEFLFDFYDKKGMKVIEGKLDEKIDEDVYTCVLKFDDEADSEKAKQINEVINKYPGIEIRFWFGGGYCELYGTHISKSRAISEVANHYSIDNDHIIVFGDSDNDIEMLRDFKHSYVMKNGNPVLFEEAKHITEFDNNNEGVAKELVKLFDVRV